MERPEERVSEERKEDPLRFQGEIRPQLMNVRARALRRHFALQLYLKANTLTKGTRKELLKRGLKKAPPELR